MINTDGLKAIDFDQCGNVFLQLVFIATTCSLRITTDASQSNDWAMNRGSSLAIGGTKDSSESFVFSTLVRSHRLSSVALALPNL
ncbi:hypothetical protein CEE69_12035 [Rhodopirellula bahusiensis]|uniref:Uncharacterized protein n=1 Tax=Rhodopirellula bahusiensis TaxID=2014065 RepID=A0A2G1W803_9BACT|nr:hypothetical protein CEE69_12035 [Rhodopirellula bahusiensis]